VDALRRGAGTRKLKHRGIELSVWIPVACRCRDLQGGLVDGTPSWCHGDDRAALMSEAAPRLRRGSDLLVTVTMGLYVASLQGGAAGLPRWPPAVVMAEAKARAGVVEAAWRAPAPWCRVMASTAGRQRSATSGGGLRLHPRAGLGCCRPLWIWAAALTVMYGQRSKASRGTAGTRLRATDAAVVE